MCVNLWNKIQNKCVEIFFFLNSTLLFPPLSVDLTVFCFINCNQHFKSNICNLTSKSSKREIWQEQKQVWFSIHNPTGVQPDGWLSLYRIWAGSSETPKQEKCLCLSVSQKLYFFKKGEIQRVNWTKESGIISVIPHPPLTPAFPHAKRASPQRLHHTFLF